MLNNENLLISAVINQKDHINPAARGITKKFFYSYPDEWAFIERYIAKHKRTPSKAAFAQRFPEFNIKKSADDVNYFCEEVRNGHKVASITSVIQDALADLESGDVDKALASIGHESMQIQSQLGGVSGDEDVIEHHQDVLDEVMRRVARNKDYGQAGIPTGFPTLDDRTGGPQPGHVWIWAARLGQGKFTRDTEPVMTPDGWKKKGDLRVNDFITGSNGKPTRVVAVYPHKNKRVFKVNFSDGTVVECGDEHLWTVRIGSKPYKVWTTEEIQKWIENGKQQPSVPTLSAPVLFTGSRSREKTLYKPYLLGLLLGDGSLCGGMVTFTTADPELVEGWGRNAKHYDGYQYGISRLKPTIEKLGLWGHRSWEKFIPHDYKISEPHQRHALLQGLMDTDGGATATGGVEYTTTSKRLCKDITEVVQSLGGHVHMNTNQNSYPYKGEKKLGRVAYRMIIVLPPQFPPFRLQRKLDKWIPRSKYQPSRSIVSVEATDTYDDMTCITVENPDSLYVVSGCILTHNTWSLVRTAAAACFSGYNIQYDALESSRPEIAMRFHTFASSEYGKEVFKNLDLSQGRNFSPRSYKEFLQELRSHVKGRMHIADTSNGPVNPLTIASQIERNKPDAVFLDYITLLDGVDSASDDWRSIGKTSKMLKQIAERYQIPIIAAAQLNRNAALGKGPAGPEALAESDAIGRDADAVITMKQLSKHVIQMKLAKFRHGRDGYSWYCKFLPNTGFFEEVTFDEAQDIIADDEDSIEEEENRVFAPRKKGSYVNASEKRHAGQKPVAKKKKIVVKKK